MSNRWDFYENAKEYYSFLEISEQQVEIEDAVHTSNNRPLFVDTWKTHKKLFGEIDKKCPGINTYIRIFYAVFYLDWYFNIIKEKPNDKHHFENFLKKLENCAKTLGGLVDCFIDYPIHKNDIIIELQNYLEKENIESFTISMIIDLIKDEFNIKKLNTTHKYKESIKKAGFFAILFNFPDKDSPNHIVKLRKKYKK